MRILVFGRDGQVGRALQPALAALGEAVSLGRAEADFTRPQTLGALVEAHRPDVVVVAAAYTAVDAAESDRDTAFAVNATAVGEIGRAAKKIGVPVVSYSTDYVYDGEAGDPHREDETPNPRSVYGASKLAGEEALRASGADHVILRTSWVYAPDGKNFPLTMLRLAREREHLRVVADQIGAPTPAKLIAEATARVIPQLLSDRSKAGIYHFAAAGETSWHGFARLVIAEARRAGAVLKAGADEVEPVTTADYPTPARRPANSVLDTTRFRATFGGDIPRWEEGVRVFIEDLSRKGLL